MTQRKKSQNIGLLMSVVFSVVLLWALAAIVWPIPVVYADDPEILTITVTSSRETYFYDPGLDPTGGTVYFNSLVGRGAGQVFTVTTTVTGSMPITLTGATAFGMMPIPDTNSTGKLGINYTIGINADTENGVLFMVTDSDGLTDTAVITFTQDNLMPTVEFTDVTNPGCVSAGSNWYDPDNLSSGWHFTYTVTDTLSGLALVSASWDHSNDIYDQIIDPGLGGHDVFNGVGDDGDGVVTVTLTITDNVGNLPASDIVVFNLDNTEPITTSAYITESSVYLYADGLTIYYGNGMGSTKQAFVVGGQSEDDGVGLSSVGFSTALGDDHPINQGTLSHWWGEYDVTCHNTDSGTITVTVSDRLGNLDYQTFKYIWDTEAPTVVVTCPAVTFQPSFLVSWDGSDPPPSASGVRHYDVQYKVSSDGVWQNWYVSIPYTITQATFGPDSPVTVKDGETYYFRVRAKDNVSNEGPYSKEGKTLYDGDKEVFLPIVMKSYCDCGLDNYEPNDSFSQAYGPLTSGPIYKSYVSCCDVASRRDYFYIHISTTNAINIDLTNIPAGVDYDLYLYNASQAEVDKSRQDGNLPEHISYGPPRAGKYYILVFSPYSHYSASQYSLRVTYD